MVAAVKRVVTACHHCETAVAVHGVVVDGVAEFAWEAY